MNSEKDQKIENEEQKGCCSSQHSGKSCCSSSEEDGFSSKSGCACSSFKCTPCMFIWGAFIVIVVVSLLVK